MGYGDSWNTPHARTVNRGQKQGIGNVAAQIFAPRNQEIYVTQHWIFNSRSSRLNVIGRRTF